MSPLVAIGRVLFVILFVYSGADKLLNLPDTTAYITQKVVPAIPAVAAPYVTQVEMLASMPVAQLIAILAAALEIGGGVLIALNIGARFFAVLLAIYSITTIYFFHDFWNMTGADKTANIYQALKNLSIIGGLLILIGFPSRAVDDANYTGTPDKGF